MPVSKTAVLFESPSGEADVVGGKIAGAVRNIIAKAEERVNNLSKSIPFVVEDEVQVCAQVSGLSLDRVRELSAFANERGQPLVDTIIERGGINEKLLLRSLADKLGMEYFSDNSVQISDATLAQIPASLAMRYRVIPVDESPDGRLFVATSDPFEWCHWDELAQIFGRPLERVLCPRTEIDKLLRNKYGLGADTVERLIASKEEQVQIGRGKSTDLSEAEAANEPTVVNLVNRILTEAIRSGATDIHFEPYDQKYRVRYRIDGMLEDVAVPASVKLLKLALVSRIKIMADLDITEKRLPQDGRAQVSLAGKAYDLRVSILPGVYGEAVNIRLQNRQMVKFELEALGFRTDDREKIEHLTERPHGLILVTGPTGSGKTTTLYTCLTKISSPEVKVLTVEDPVEFWMDDILQMQVHEEIGFTFARALRSMLRHDPDVMLVGEIRDRETADIAIRASLTGHLVFATLHTNDAPSAITRLIDIGIEPFLVASSISGVVAQRLMRTVCVHCKRQVPAQDVPGIDTSWEGQGCEKCRFTGFKGRTAVGEIMLATPAVRELIRNRETADRIKELAVKEGMTTLRESALLAVKAGKTSVAEMIRVTIEDE